MPVLDAVFLGGDDREWGSADPADVHLIKTQGTTVFYIVAAAYMLIHHSHYFGIRQRIRFAGFVNMFVAHWRCWVIKTPGLTLQKNFLTKECYSDLVQSCHEAVFTCMTFKMYASSLPLRLIYSGSNVCENSFSKAGGYRGTHGKRNYDVMDYCDYAENEYVMEVLEMAGVRRGRAQHAKQEWDSRCHEPRITQAELDAKLKNHPTLPEMTASWNAGAKDASHLAEIMGLRHRITDAHWFDPWDGMREKLHVMEVVDDSSSSEEDDDDVYLDPHVPPPEQTATVMDARVCTLDLLKQNGATSENGLWKVAKWIDAYLFTEIVDHVAVSKLMASMALTCTRQDVLQAREERKRKIYVTTPGSHVMVSLRH
jgi:hypothetical protein